MREAGIRVLSLLKDPEVARGLAHVSLAPADLNDTRYHCHLHFHVSLNG